MNKQSSRFKIDFRCARIRTAVFAALILTGSSAVAQQGSFADTFPLSNSDSSNFITVYDREDIEASGAKNFQDFWNYVPYAATAVNSRIYVDGRPQRDWENIPFSAVERIEVVSNGAGLFGGEAIGGAVNIVLIDEFEGSDFQLGFLQPSLEGDDANFTNFTLGSKNQDASFIMGVDYFRRDEILDKDRDFSKASWEINGDFSDTNGVSAGGNTVFRDNFNNASSLGPCSTDVYTGVLNDPSGVEGTGCGFPYANYRWLTGNWERTGFFFKSAFSVNEGSEVYTKFDFAQRDTENQGAPAVGTFEINNQSAFNLQFPFVVDETISAFHRFVAHGN